MQQRLRHLTAAICALNAKYIHSSLAPWCLLAGVNSYCADGISAEVVEGTINEKPEDVARRITALNPRVVGFCCYIWNIGATRQLIRLVKDRLPGAIIVLGGPEVSYNAEQVLREQPQVQYIVSGEGEKPFALLLNAIFEGETAPSVPGLCCREEGRSVIAPPYLPGDDPPSPYTEKYLQALNGRIAYLETGRGCPYSCAFCLSGRCGGARYFDLKRAKRELLLLANSGAQTVKLVDRTFNANRKRANELFAFIIRNYGNTIPKGVCFHFEIAGDILNDETIALLSSAPAGSIQLEIGLQSFHAPTLDAIRRKTDVERLKNNIRKVVSGGNMHIHIDLIAGLPLEDWDSFAESFDTAYSLKPNMLQLGFLKLLHGAPMRESPDEFPCRYAEQAPYEVVETPWLTQGELEKLRHAEDALERLYNSGRFRRTIEYVLTRTGITPFALFHRFGGFSFERGTERITLDNYTALVFEYFSGQNGIDKNMLRDRMVCDRLATNSSGRLPAVLDRKDPELKKALKELKKSPETRPEKGVKRGAALLYSERCVVFADYRDKDPVSGEYPLHKAGMKTG